MKFSLPFHFPILIKCMIWYDDNPMMFKVFSKRYESTLNKLLIGRVVLWFFKIDASKVKRKRKLKDKLIYSKFIDEIK